jgi:hypothetical protein
MNSSGYREVKKFSERERHIIESKIRSHDRLESAWRSIEAADNERKLLVRVDNARPYTAKLSIQYFHENRMKSAPHLPHSPDLAPSDLYLFGYVKSCLAGLSFKNADQLRAAV